MSLQQNCKNLVVSYRFHSNFCWVRQFSRQKTIFIISAETKKHAVKKYGQKTILKLQRENRLQFRSRTQIIALVQNPKFKIWLRYIPRSFFWPIFLKSKKNKIVIFEQFFYHYSSFLLKTFKYVAILIELSFLKVFFKSTIYNYLTTFRYFCKKIDFIVPKNKKLNKKLLVQKKLILCVARFTKRKKIMFFTSIVNEIKKYKLLLIGNVISQSDEFEYLKIKKCFAKKNIKILKNIPNHLMHTYYKKAKCLVLPSVDEPFSLAPLEAAAHGAQVLISESNGLAFAGIKRKWLHFFIANSKEDFLQQVKKMLNQE